MAKLSDEQIVANLLSRLPETIEYDLGVPMAGAQVPSSGFVDSFRGRLPSYLLDLWSDFGFGLFSRGGFKLTNPELYREHLAWWIKDTPLVGIDEYHVVARGPFGDWCVWAERSCETFRVRVPQGLFATGVVHLEVGERTERETLSAFESFLFDFSHKDDATEALHLGRLDHAGPDGLSLFEAWVSRHGPLADPSKVLGFAPYLFAGGTATLDGVDVVDEFVQLDLIREFLGKPLFKDISTFPG
jgi:hypothetical protein